MKTLKKHQSAITSKAADGFTMIELVVVLVILNILAGMLLPALCNTKDKSQFACCLNNNKQLMAALHMYTMNNGDRMPNPGWSNGSPTAGWLYSPGGGTPPLSTLSTAQSVTNWYPIISPAVRNAYESGALWPFIKNPAVYRCPLDKPNTTKQTKITREYWYQRNNKMSTYVMTGAVVNFGSLQPLAATHKINAFNPLAYVMWEPSDDKPIGSFTYYDSSSYPDMNEGMSARHGKGGVISAFAGHVEFITLKKFADELIRRPGLLWCVPGSPTGQ